MMNLKRVDSSNTMIQERKINEMKSMNLMKEFNKES